MKIPLWDMRQKIQFVHQFNIHSLEWKSTEGSIMRNATRDSGQDLNSYQKFTALNETANKIPLWDMWQKIQFDI